MLICARAAEWCAGVFNAVANSLLAQHADGSDRHKDVQQIVKCTAG